jgi:hypothetical protein
MDYKVNHYESEVFIDGAWAKTLWKNVSLFVLN